MIYVSNAFRLSMSRGAVSHPIQLKLAKSFATSDGVESAIGNEYACRLINKILKTNFKVNRKSFPLVDGDILIIAQYVGPRPPEGSQSLPKGARIQWYFAMECKWACRACSTMIKLEELADSGLPDYVLLPKVMKVISDYRQRK